MKHSKLICALWIIALLLIDLSPTFAQELSPTRRLRRVHLSLLMTEPSVEQYEAIIAAPDPDAFARQITMSCVIEKYEIQRQESFIERLNSAEERFWWRVLEARKRQSPELTESAARAGQLNLFG